jgi:hypothetical protein
MAYTFAGWVPEADEEKIIFGDVSVSSLRGGNVNDVLNTNGSGDPAWTADLTVNSLTSVDVITDLISSNNLVVGKDPATNTILNINNTQKDAQLQINADSNNVGEDNQSSIFFACDGYLTKGFTGFTDSDNSFKIATYTSDSPGIKIRLGCVTGFTETGGVENPDIAGTFPALEIDDRNISNFGQRIIVDGDVTSKGTLRADKIDSETGVNTVDIVTDTTIDGSLSFSKSASTSTPLPQGTVEPFMDFSRHVRYFPLFTAGTVSDNGSATISRFGSQVIFYLDFCPTLVPQETIGYFSVDMTLPIYFRPQSEVNDIVAVVVNGSRITCFAKYDASFESIVIGQNAGFNIDDSVQLQPMSLCWNVTSQ